MEVHLIRALSVLGTTVPVLTTGMSLYGVECGGYVVCAIKIYNPSAMILRNRYRVYLETGL